MMTPKGRVVQLGPGGRGWFGDYDTVIPWTPEPPTVIQRLCDADLDKHERARLERENDGLVVITMESEHLRYE